MVSSWDRARKEERGERPEVGVLRRFPYPYLAMLAICSDLDETPNAAAYFETARFLNTTAPTRMGQGLGLEVGNTIYFGMPPAQFAYWNTDDTGRAMVRDLIKSGHIDCLHSFGDVARTRADASRALDELTRHGCRLEVWVDHGAVPTNFGSDIMCGSGDVPGSEAFHADLSCAFGVRFVWRGRVTSVIGQNVRRRLTGIVTLRQPLASADTVAREFAKGLVARCGNAKYAPHAHNRVMWPATLRGGQRVFEFMRANPSWAGVSRLATGRELGEVLTTPMLAQLVRRSGVMVLYTHLGKADRAGLLPAAACSGLERLAAFSRSRQVLVATTRRLLGYCRAVEAVRVSVEQRSDSERISVHTGGGLHGADLQGLTVYSQRPEGAVLLVDGQQAGEYQINPPDETGRPSLSLPWKRLEFPS